MSGIVELAYTVLLGWMRTVFDWFWSMLSGTGNSSGWSWFLSNWKMWLVVLVVGGLIVDWLTWVLRWRPYRVLFSRFRRVPAQDAYDNEDWDSGVGYYEQETAVDSEPPDWADTTFATLSEIDPNWAGDIIISDEEDQLYDPSFDPAKTGFYQQTYDEPEPEPIEAVQPEEEDSAGFWSITSDELPLYVEQEEPPPIQAPEPDFDPYAPYDAFMPEDLPEYESEVTDLPDEPMIDAPAGEPDDMETGELPEMPLLYGRPTTWPGAQFPFAMQGNSEPEPQEPAPEPYDPLFNPDAPVSEDETDRPRRRRRRRLRESVPEEWQPEDPVPADQESASAFPASSEPVPLPTWLDPPPPPSLPDEGYAMEPQPAIAPAPPPSNYDPAAFIMDADDISEDTRPSRLVRPAPEQRQPEPPEKKGKWGRKKEKKGPRTVTGKPALRRGLMRLTSAQDEPISGLPPMHLTNPFLPPVLPTDVDFAPDEGEEYDDD